MATDFPAGLGELLRCPVCGDGFVFTPVAAQPLPDSVFGVLACADHRYPVIDGIPVIRDGRVSVHDHMTGRAEVLGPTVAELVKLVRSADPLAALVELLAFPPALPFGLETVPVARLPLTRGPGERASMRRRRALVRRRLGDLTDQTAQDWLELSYLRTRNVNRELYPYFLNRFGQPRYLASLALVRALPPADRPVLDLACGFGHLMFHLGARSQPHESVGVDRNFFQLWVARRWVAPGAAFVCADANRPLPFVAEAFSASLCTDAFHLFDDQPGCLAELQRCAVGRTVVLDRVGNRLVEPHDGESERSPQGYVDLLGGVPHRLIGETELTDGYLAGHGPALAAPRPVAEFAEQKFLSLVSAADPTLFTDHGDFPEFPHADGPLGINPIYRISPDGADVMLVFEFPSTWYAFENSRSLAYHAPAIRLSRNDFDALRRGQPTERTDELVRKFALLAMPEHYVRPPVTG
ncbi:MAG TPA: class I SAM-dependent methyltransferase [Pseudonocardiaceae bacterium]|jgi:SAM-dependent methyltransferase|nr:class I SAM-dependent methyltransferase [Pseudonocardiaceae bacterium]